MVVLVLQARVLVDVRYIWISMPWATFVLGIERGVIHEAPPIARWTIGKNQKVVADYYRKRGAEFVIIGDSDDQ